MKSDEFFALHARSWTGLKTPRFEPVSVQCSGNSHESDRPGWSIGRLDPAAGKLTEYMLSDILYAIRMLSLPVRFVAHASSIRVEEDLQRMRVEVVTVTAVENIELPCWIVGYVAHNYVVTLCVGEHLGRQIALAIVVVDHHPS